MAVDISALRQWIGRQETVADPMPLFPAAALAATLDSDECPRPGAALPPLWHWVYFRELHPGSALADNGHPTLGDFLPPVPLPRRMYAGGRFTFLRPLVIGEPARRISTVADVSLKSGRSGDMVFVLVRHEIAGPAGPALVEEQDIVYREPPRAGDRPPAEIRPAAQPAWRREVVTGVPLLFRYSALLFNAYRIHYDRPYAQSQGYAGLVVHGPLIATLLAGLARRGSGAPLKAFRFRAVSPLVDGAPWAVCGVPREGGAELWAENAQGVVVMQAQAEFAAR